MLAVTSALDRFFDMSGVPDYWVSLSDQSEIEQYRRFSEENGYISHESEVIQVDHSGIYVEDKMLTYSNAIFLSTLDKAKVFDKKDNEITNISEGEIYVSAELFNSGENNFRENGKIVIDTGTTKKEFTLKGYVKDALLGSSMIGCTRFLMSKEDFALFAEAPDAIKATFFYTFTDDPDKFNELPMNSKLLSAVRNAIKMTYIMDSLIAAIILVASVCLILVSMVILHFTITFTLNEELREIGVMKAIGIKNWEIRALYISKYVALTLVGTTVGLLLSFPIGSAMLESVKRKIVISNENGFLLNLAAALLAAAAVILFCVFCTRRVKKLSPIDAIRRGETGERYGRKNIFSLSKLPLPTPFFMALNDILSGFKKYVSMTVIFILGTLLIIIPINTANTLRSDSIIQCFNMARCDHVIQQDIIYNVNVKKIESKLSELKAYLKERNVEANTFQEMVLNTQISFEGKCQRSLGFIGIGDVTTDMYSAYIKGTPPQHKNEVALSYITAENIGAEIGDTVQASVNGGTSDYIITALYQSMNNMGEGVRFHQDAEIDLPNMVGCFGVQVAYTDNPDGDEMKERMQILSEYSPDDEVYTTGEYINRMIGDVAGQISDVEQMIFIIVICINVLVAVLMVKSFITKEKSEIALLKATGFSNNILTLWQSLRIGIVLLISTLLGAVISNPLSHLIITPIFRMMGAYSIEYEVNFWETYVGYPLIVVTAAFLAALISAQTVRTIKSSDISNIEI